MKQVLVMAKIGRPIKFVIRLTPEERTRLERDDPLRYRRGKLGFKSADIA